MIYLPAFDFLSTRYALQANTLHVNRGQWVTQGQGKGRIVALGKSLKVLWRMKGESFRSYVLRFKSALCKFSKSVPQRFHQLSLDLVPTTDLFIPESASDQCFGCTWCNRDTEKGFYCAHPENTAQCGNVLITLEPPISKFSTRSCVYPLTCEVIMSYLLHTTNTAGTRTLEAHVFGGYRAPGEPKTLQRFWIHRHATAQELEMAKARNGETYHCYG